MFQLDSTLAFMLAIAVWFASVLMTVVIGVMTAKANSELIRTEVQVALYKTAVPEKQHAEHTSCALSLRKATGVQRICHTSVSAVPVMAARLSRPPAESRTAAPRQSLVGTRDAAARTLRANAAKIGAATANKPCSSCGRSRDAPEQYPLHLAWDHLFRAENRYCSRLTR